MSSEVMRKKISEAMHEELPVIRDGPLVVARITDRILALLTPATAKLPEGVEIVPHDHYFEIRCRGYYYTGSTSHPWMKPNNVVGPALYSDSGKALTAALAAPPVPVLQKPTTAEKPDPLARAVTAREMLWLAEAIVSMPVTAASEVNVAQAIRTIFTPPQGAAHAE